MKEKEGEGEGEEEREGEREEEEGGAGGGGRGWHTQQHFYSGSSSAGIWVISASDKEKAVNTEEIPQTLSEKCSFSCLDIIL